MHCKGYAIFTLQMYDKIVVKMALNFGQLDTEKRCLYIHDKTPKFAEILVNEVHVITEVWISGVELCTEGQKQHANSPPC